MTRMFGFIAILSTVCVSFTMARLSLRAPTNFNETAVSTLNDVLVGYGDNSFLVNFEDAIVNNENDLFFNLEDENVALAANEWILEWDVQNQGLYDLVDQQGQVNLILPNGTVTNVNDEIAAALGINSSDVSSNLSATVQNITSEFENVNNGVQNGTNVSTAALESTLGATIVGLQQAFNNALNPVPVVNTTVPVNNTNIPVDNTTPAVVASSGPPTANTNTPVTTSPDGNGGVGSVPAQGPPTANINTPIDNSASNGAVASEPAQGPQTANINPPTQQ